MCCAWRVTTLCVHHKSYMAAVWLNQYLCDEKLVLSHLSYGTLNIVL